MRITFIAKNVQGVVTDLINVAGEVRVDTKREYMHRSSHPFIPEKEYRFIPFFEESIEVKMVANEVDSQKVRDVFSIDTNEVFLQWRGGRYVHNRKLDITRLPGHIRLFDTHILDFEIKYREVPEIFDVERLTRVRSSGVSYKIITGE